MSDYNQLVQENHKLHMVIDKLEKNNLDLRLTITDLRNKQEEYEKLLKQYEILRRENQDLVKRHLDLEDSNAELRKYHKEVEGYAARVYDPNKSTYKELEDKLALAKNSKQAEIDELYETTIAPLQNEVKDKKIQLESAYKQDIRNMEEIGHLKNHIENLKMTINYAAGYISSCEQFRDKYPNYVKDWLFQGIKQ